MTDAIGFGVIGCGRMGMRRIERIVRHPNATLICVADVQGEKAKAAGERYGVEYFTDFNKVINRRDVECGGTPALNKFQRPTPNGVMKKGKKNFVKNRWLETLRKQKEWLKHL